MRDTNTLSLLRSINIALTDEHLAEIDAGRMDVYLAEDREIVNVHVWESDDLDELPTRFVIRAERAS